MTPPCPFKWRDMSFIIPLLSYTQQHVVLCLSAKSLLRIMINIYTTSAQCRDTALFFFPSFTSVCPGDIGQMLLTNRSQTNQRVQEIHHNINPLNPELNPICYLLALLGAHHFLHVSRIRVKLLTFRRLMSYIYIYGAPILDVSRSHTTTQHSR